VNLLPTASVASTLTTAGGKACTIVSGNQAAIPVVHFMAEALGLAADLCDLDPPTGQFPTSYIQLYVQNDHLTASLPGTGRIFVDGKSTVCHIDPAFDRDMLATQMIWLSPFFTQAIGARGGALIHGALVEWHGSGVIFAGPGGIGKSTLCGRLPQSWRSLSDDMTLIDRDADGNYWAHPWPTWSRFMWGGEGATWDVSSAVPLKAIFILEQGKKTKIVSCGAGQSAMLLDEVADQASFFAYDSLDRDGARRHRINRFNSMCGMAQKVPTSVLHTSLTLPFANELEHFLES
jgi:SynChlorMet cassette protein ScmC